MSFAMAGAPGVVYEPVDKAVAVAALVAAGISTWHAEAHMNMVIHYSKHGQSASSAAAFSGKIKSDIERITGKPPTKLHSWVKKTIKPLLADE